jgi:hypothetical protein
LRKTSVLLLLGLVAGCARSVDDGGFQSDVANGGQGGAGRYEAPVTPGAVPLAVGVSIQEIGTVPAQGTRRFVAIVHNAENVGVTWSLAERSGGKIDPETGAYTAPPSGGTFHVTATSNADPSAKATATFNVARATVRAYPAEVSVAQGALYGLHATVAEANDERVAWSVVEGAMGGSVDAASGAYTAPSTPGVYHVRATSVEDPSASDVVRIDVPFTDIAVTPSFATLDPSTSRAFGASIAGPSQTVTWRVAEAGGGTVTPAGVYTAPGTNGIYHLVATGVADPTMVTTVPVLVGNVMPAITSEGGPVDATPVFQAITFAGDAVAATLESFVAQYGASDVWRAQTSEYGVGAAGAAPPVHEASLPSHMKDAELQAWLANEVDGTHAGVAAPSPSTIYVLYLGPDTTVSAPVGDTCSPLGGYHSYLTLAGGMKVPYVVVARCHGDDVDWLTQLSSHELVEAVTDPLVNGNQAYAFSDGAHEIWGLLHPEVADLCEWDTISSQTNITPASLGYQIQRTFSNASAAAGHEPCVPAIPNEVYFTAVPRMSESVTVTSQGQSYGTNGVHIPYGHSKTISVDLIADGPRDKWHLFADDLGKGTLLFSFDDDDGASGDTVHMTITVLRVDYDWDGEPFEIVSYDGRESHAYLGFVAN